MDDPKQREDWNTLLAVRTEVLKALEEARQSKLIGGANLEAQVTITAAEPVYSVLARYQDRLRYLFIVSDVTLQQGKVRKRDRQSQCAGKQGRRREVRALLELLHSRGRGCRLSHRLRTLQCRAERDRRVNAAGLLDSVFASWIRSHLLRLQFSFESVPNDD